MNGKRRSMLGTRGNLNLQPLKLNLASKESSLESNRKNRPGLVSFSSTKTDQSVAKRLFGDNINIEEKESISTKSKSALASKEKSPLGRNSWNQNVKGGDITLNSQSHLNCSNSNKNGAVREGVSLSVRGVPNRMSSKFEFLNSPRFLHRNGGNIPQSPKTPPIWSNIVKLKRNSSAFMIKSPDEPQCLSRNVSLLTSTAHKNSSSSNSGSVEKPDYSAAGSPNLSAIKVKKSADKHGEQSVKNLYPDELDASCFSDATLINESVKDEKLSETFHSFVLSKTNDRSNDDSFIENETLCFMDAEDKTLSDMKDYKENIYKPASNASNCTVIPATPHTPRRLSAITEEGPYGDLLSNPNSKLSDSNNEQVTLWNLVQSLVSRQENFIREQDELIKTLVTRQTSFFSKQNEILQQTVSILKKTGRVPGVGKESFVLKNFSQNEIVTDCIAGNGNDDDDEDSKNDGNISLICATKKLKIQDDVSNPGTPRRSLRIQDKRESAQKSEKKSNERKSRIANCMDTEEVTVGFKSDFLTTPENQKNGAHLSHRNQKLFLTNRPGSSDKLKFKTPVRLRKSVLVENLSKYQTPNKRTPNSSLKSRSGRISKTPRKNYPLRDSPLSVNSTTLMKNLRRSCAFMKTPKNTTRMSMNPNSVLTPHSMSLVVQDQMQNIFNS